MKYTGVVSRKVVGKATSKLLVPIPMMASKPEPVMILIGDNGSYMAGYSKDDYGQWDNPYIGGHEVSYFLSNSGSKNNSLYFVGGIKLVNVDVIRVTIDGGITIDLAWDDVEKDYIANDSAFADRMWALNGQWAAFLFDPIVSPAIDYFERHAGEYYDIGGGEQWQL